ncbi:MAG: calcium/sodium antiporter [Oscillospiraceae bacterium]|nr:calcium/sodium antiporter [Oscillospiraceae bacterium]
MSITVTVILFALGLVLIIKGGDWFVDSAVWFANLTGIPKFIVGATIVSIATTLPELTVSVTGVIEGELDMAVGNAVGSVTANIGLIMGISLVCIPAAVKRSQLCLKAVLMSGSALCLWLLCRNGELRFLPSLFLFAIFFEFLWDNIRSGKKDIGSDDREPVDKKDMPKEILLFIIGIAAIIIGSRLLITYGSELAIILGVPAAIVGVTMVAIGTSLPELVTTITAIRKKEASMSVGNIIGANVIDLTLILPVCSIVSGGGLKIAPQSYVLDMPVCFGMTLLAVVPPLITGRFRRWQGVAMLICYAAYVVVLVKYFGV